MKLFKTKAAAKLTEPFPLDYDVCKNAEFFCISMHTLNVYENVSNYEIVLLSKIPVFRKTLEAVYRHEAQVSDPVRDAHSAAGGHAPPVRRDVYQS